MGTYFNPRRRKIGVVTLLMALLFMGGCDIGGNEWKCGSHARAVA